MRPQGLNQAALGSARGSCESTSKPIAVFLDRDGVLIEEAQYLADPAQVTLLPAAAEAVARLNHASIPVVVVTNQSGVARGYFPESRVAEIHARINDLLAAAGARIDCYYYCPHHPTAGTGTYRTECECRKPRPGMLCAAAWELDLELRGSFIVGDKLSDLRAGQAVGCRPVLVRTGYGAETAARLDEHDCQHVHVVDSLLDAVESIVMPGQERDRAA